MLYLYNKKIEQHFYFVFVFLFFIFFLKFFLIFCFSTILYTNLSSDSSLLAFVFSPRDECAICLLSLILCYILLVRDANYLPSHQNSPVLSFARQLIHVPSGGYPPTIVPSCAGTHAVGFSVSP